MLVYFKDEIPLTRWVKAGFSPVFEATCLHSGSGHCCRARRDDVSNNVPRDWPNASVGRRVRPWTGSGLTERHREEEKQTEVGKIL